MNHLPSRALRIARSAGLLAVGMMLLGSAGCTIAENTAAGTKNLVNEAANATTDASITFAVKTALSNDDLVNSEKIAVDTERGVVTLRGTQQTDQARREAETIARQTKGVRAVVDRIEVLRTFQS